MLHYLERRQEAFTVTRNDLEDLVEDDSIQSWSTTFGVGLLAAAAPLGVEHGLMDPGPFKMNTLLWLCVIASIVGVIFLYIGIRAKNKKLRRLSRIYSELSPVGGKTITTPGAT